jgi:hypothetical protein
LIRLPVVDRWRTDRRGRGCACRRVAPSWPLGRDAKRLVHSACVPWQREACHPWSARLARRHYEYAKWTGTVQRWLSHRCDACPGLGAWSGGCRLGGPGRAVESRLWGRCRAPAVPPLGVRGSRGSVASR